ncbi:PQQ-dependent dehydrogenase, methanol/ethanol family [Variovorax sp. LjRoot178]|uniref:PQQ-dependent dehydrogenase, methanol/ethanol family n=1 Tax=Variovorax sp. LjRoot178 TaxID=3342277 RepID=UPI003F51084D
MKTHEYVRRLASVGLSLCFALGLGRAEAAPSSHARVDAQRLAAAHKEPGSWMTSGGSYYETHYSALDKINVANVSKLGLAWAGDFDTNRGQQATPLFVDGVLYTSTSWSKVYAYDAASGKELWRYDPKVRPQAAQNACCDVANRGVAAWNGKIFVGTLDGRLVALDASTGQEVWSQVTVDQTKPYTITGQPRAFKGKVIIGNAGAEFGVRGYVSAYDAETGALAWRFYLTPNPNNEPDGAASDRILRDVAYPTWGDGVWKQSGGGGTAWDAILYDPDFDQIIVGGGNGTPWSWKTRSGAKGDDLFLGSVVALDANTGEYRWHYQETPGDDWDYTSSQPIILTELVIDGARRKVALHAPKNGFFYVIDRQNGKLVSAEKFAMVNWASGIDKATGRPIVYPQARYGINGTDFLATPGSTGAHNWHPMAFSPKTKLVYIPVQNIPYGYKDNPNYKYRSGDGAYNLGTGSARNTPPFNESDRRVGALQTEGYLLAWDPVRQAEVWRVNHGAVSSAGVLATAGDLVFQGAADGRLVAYRANDGQKVWSWQGFDGIVAGAMSYMMNGEQYIAVLSGYGGANAIHVPFTSAKAATNGRLLVFKLGGNAKLLDNSKPYGPAVVSAESFTPAQVSLGEKLYYSNCASCHGKGMNTNNMLPDLRRSSVPSNREAFDAIVLKGILESRGMKGWASTLSSDDTEALRAYIQSTARVLEADLAVEKQAERKPSGPAPAVQPVSQWQRSRTEAPATNTPGIFP